MDHTAKERNITRYPVYYTYFTSVSISSLLNFLLPIFCILDSYGTNNDTLFKYSHFFADVSKIQKNELHYKSAHY